MDKYQIIKDIVFMPEKFGTAGNVSMYSLLKESGYFEFYNEINEIDIFQVLTKFPECVNEWITWSENRRASSGWYIMNKGDKYIVGYYPENKNFKALEYFNVEEACATFIKKAIEIIRNIKKL